MKHYIITAVIILAAFAVGVTGALFFLGRNDRSGPDQDSIPTVTPQDTSDEPKVDEDPADALMLSSMGLWNSQWMSGDSPVMNSAERVGRLDALTLVAKAMGYNSAMPALETPFTDVTGAEAGPLGFLVYKGVLAGGEPRELERDGAVSLVELASYVLRGMGDGSADETNSMDKLRALGSYEDEYGDGSAAATRRQLSALLLKLLCSEPAGWGKTYLSLLAESGAVTLTDSAYSSLPAGALKGLDTEAQPGSTFVDRLFTSAFTVKYTDAEGNATGDGSGFFVSEGVGAAALSSVRGGANAEIIDSSGEAREFRGVLSYDLDEDYVFFSCDTGGKNLGNSQPLSAENETVYILDGAAIPGVGLEYTGLVPKGLPVVGSHGEFLGFTTGETGVLSDAQMPDSPRTIYNLGMELWPDDYPLSGSRVIDPDKPMVALTFDDGPSGKYTPRILDVLEEYNCVATFFEVGTSLSKNPDYLQRMEEMGCEIGSHSYTHTSFKTMTADEIRDELEKVNEIVRSKVGHDAEVVRAPYGATNEDVRAAVDFPLIGWNVDTLDWQSRDTDAVIAMVKQEKSLDGDIVLMHSIHGCTADAVEYLVPWLLEQGYQLVTVSELAHYRGVELENGKVYYNFPPQD